MLRACTFERADRADRQVDKHDRDSYLYADGSGRQCYAPSVEDKHSNMNFLHVGKPASECLGMVIQDFVFVQPLLQACIL